MWAVSVKLICQKTSICQSHPHCMRKSSAANVFVRFPSFIIPLSGPYTGHSLGTPVLRKWRMRFYKGYIVIHLNRLELQTQAYTRSLIQHFWVFYLNVWELVDAFALKLWLNGRCCFASVLMLVWPPKPVYWRLKASRYATVSRGLWRVKSSVYNSLS